MPNNKHSKTAAEIGGTAHVTDVSDRITGQMLTADGGHTRH
jgi:hypothetical protein